MGNQIPLVSVFVIHAFGWVPLATFCPIHREMEVRRSNAWAYLEWMVLSGQLDYN